LAFFIGSQAMAEKLLYKALENSIPQGLMSNLRAVLNFGLIKKNYIQAQKHLAGAVDVAAAKKQDAWIEFQLFAS